MDFAGIPSSSDSVPDPSINQIWQAIHQLANSIAALQGMTNQLLTGLQQLNVAITNRMNSDPTPSDSLPGFAKGSGPRISEPITYDREFNDHVCDEFITRLTDWIDFYERRQQWADESEKVTVAAGFFRGRLRILFDLERSSATQPGTFPELLEWIRLTSQGVLANHRRREEWQQITQQAVTDRKVMTYATELLQLAKRVEPQKSNPETTLTRSNVI